LAIEKIAMGGGGAAALGDVASLSLLGDRVRLRLYEFVARSGRPVSREECADGVRIDRSLAAYHLDRLVDRGLLEASYRRPSGRGGPGAGRPPKLYRRATREFVCRTPPRDYRLLAELLVRVADEAGTEVREAIERAACEVGHRLGAAARDHGGTRRELLREFLHDQGYEPYIAEPGLLRFRNCPFHAVADRHPELVCALNLALVQGMLAGVGADAAEAELAPQQGSCCVAIGTRDLHRPCASAR
jgi:predicted ArsR family transcriptional regulator